MEDIPFPDYSLFEFDKYLSVSSLVVGDPLPLPADQVKVAPLNTARGCCFDCTFCTHAFKQDKYRFYPFPNVIRQAKCLQETWGVNYIAFWDELTLVSVRRTEELCHAIEAEGLEFSWGMGPRGNLFKRKDLDLLRRCKDLGALTIGGALESGSPEILKAMKKHLRPDEFIEHMRVGREAGLVPTSSVVIGYPLETRETIKLTFEVCRQAGVYPSVGFLLPLPETPMYRLARERDLIQDEEEYLLRIGDRQDLHVNMTQMSDEELLGTVTEEAIRLKNDLRVPLRDDQVIKSLYYRAAEKSRG
jgi:radical SAM superfamily enzyme YgiQ (UPF0313 family)